MTKTNPKNDSTKVVPYGSTKTKTYIRFRFRKSSYLMVVPLTKTNIRFRIKFFLTKLLNVFVRTKTLTKILKTDFKILSSASNFKILSSENVINHGTSLEVRDENPQIWISMNTCPLTLKEICTDIYASRYVRCASFCTKICEC